MNNSPSRRFAEMVAELERVMQTNLPTINRETTTALLACIREQQAALEKMLYDFDESDCEYEGDRAAVANARAVLTKWRIE
jgi:hypothetical protein